MPDNEKVKILCVDDEKMSCMPWNGSFWTMTTRS